MAMMISQIQLLSNRLQKQLLFIVVPPCNVDESVLIGTPFCYHIMSEREKGS